MSIQLSYGPQVLKERWNKTPMEKKLEKTGVKIQRTNSIAKLQKLFLKIDKFYHEEIFDLPKQAERIQRKYKTQLLQGSPMRWNFSLQPIELQTAGAFRVVKSVYVYLFNCIWLKIRIPQMLNICAKILRKIENRITGYETYCLLAKNELTAEMENLAGALDLDRMYCLISVKDKIETLRNLRPLATRTHLACREITKSPGKSRISRSSRSVNFRDRKENGRKIAVFFSAWGVSGNKMQTAAKSFEASKKKALRHPATRFNPLKKELP